MPVCEASLSWAGSASPRAGRVTPWAGQRGLSCPTCTPLALAWGWAQVLARSRGAAGWLLPGTAVHARAVAVACLRCLPGPGTRPGVSGCPPGSAWPYLSPLLPPPSSGGPGPWPPARAFEVLHKDDRSGDAWLRRARVSSWCPPPAYSSLVPLLGSLPLIWGQALSLMDLWWVCCARGPDGGSLCPHPGVQRLPGAALLVPRMQPSRLEATGVVDGSSWSAPSFFQTPAASPKRSGRAGSCVGAGRAP